MLVEIHLGKPLYSSEDKNCCIGKITDLEKNMHFYVYMYLKNVT